jgi:hypothetical protein
VILTDWNSMLAFEQTLRADPECWRTHGVYADWLDENSWPAMAIYHRDRSQRLKEGWNEMAQLPPQERYDRDPQFHLLVDSLEALLHRADTTPTELREAVMLAAAHHEMRTAHNLFMEETPFK